MIHVAVLEPSSGSCCVERVSEAGRGRRVIGGSFRDGGSLGQMKTDEEEISDQLGLSRNHGMVSRQGPEGQRSADP